MCVVVFVGIVVSDCFVDFVCVVMFVCVVVCSRWCVCYVVVMLVMLFLLVLLLSLVVLCLPVSTGLSIILVYLRCCNCMEWWVYCCVRLVCSCV